MDVQQYIARENIERVIMNYKNLNAIEERHATAIMGAVDGVLGFTGRPAPGGKIIPFPGVTLAPEPEAPEPEAPPPEPPRPDIRDYLDEQGIHFRSNVVWALRDLGACNLETIAAISARKLAAHREIGKKSIDDLRAFLQSKGLDLKE